MQIKITKIDKKRDPYTPDGKPYTIYCYEVWAEVNGTSVQTTVKAFKDFTLSVGQEIEVEETEYRGQKEYKLSKSSNAKGGGGYKGKPSYTVDEFDSLFAHAHNICSEMTPNSDLTPAEYADIYQRSVATYMIRATEAGVKVAIQEKSKEDIF